LAQGTQHYSTLVAHTIVAMGGEGGFGKGGGFGDDKGKGKGKGDKGKGKGKGKGSGGSGRTVFISGFEYDTDDAALEWHFKKMGAIEDYHFQSKGSACITFVKASSAQKALAELDGSTMHGQSRYLALKLDDPDRSGGKGKGKGKGKDKGKGKGSGKYRKASGDDEDDGRSVYTSGFDFDTDDAALKEHFGGCGTIEEIYFQSKGAAVITFSEEAAATQALDLANTTMKGQTRYVAVKLDTAAHRSGDSGKASGKGKWKSRE